MTTESTVPISILMLCYNRAHYMRQAIENVIKQTYSDFEFIILDHGSTDSRVFEIASEYAEKDSRIKLYREENNQGLAYGRDKILSYASGKYIAPVEDDDYWVLDKLAKQYAFMEENNHVMVYCSSRYYVDADSRIIGQDCRPQRITMPYTGITWSPEEFNYQASGQMLRRKELLAIGGWRKFFIAADDGDLYLRIQEKYACAMTDECLVYYRKWENNTSKSKRGVMYGAVAKISASCRRQNLPDPVKDNMSIDDFILQYHFSVRYLIPATHLRYTRSFVKYYLREKAYDRLSMFLKAHQQHAKRRDNKLYLNLIAWSIYYNRLGYWFYKS